MIEFNLFRAPKPKVNNKEDSFLKQVLMIILSTTISLSLTFGTISILDYNQKKKVRRMTAMMVMSNIEPFARTLDTRSERMARADHWVQTSEDSDPAPNVIDYYFPPLDLDRINTVSL